MWGTYANDHGGVDIVGSPDDLGGLERKITDGYLGDVPLGVPPAPELVGGRSPVEALRISLRGKGILLRREGAVVEIAGDRHQLTDVIGGTLSGLAETAYKITSESVPTHVHLDPSVGRPYAPESTVEIAFHLERGDVPPH